MANLGRPTPDTRFVRSTSTNWLASIGRPNTNSPTSTGQSYANYLLFRASELQQNGFEGCFAGPTNFDVGGFTSIIIPETALYTIQATVVADPVTLFADVTQRVPNIINRLVIGKNYLGLFQNMAADQPVNCLPDAKTIEVRTISGARQCVGGAKCVIDETERVLEVGETVSVTATVYLQKGDDISVVWGIDQSKGNPGPPLQPTTSNLKQVIGSANFSIVKQAADKGMKQITAAEMQYTPPGPITYNRTW